MSEDEEKKTANEKNKIDDQVDEDEDDDEDIKLIFDDKDLLERIDGSLKKFTDVKPEPSSNTESGQDLDTAILAGASSTNASNLVEKESPILVRHVKREERAKLKESTDSKNISVIFLDSDDDDEMLCNVSINFEAEKGSQKTSAKGKNDNDNGSSPVEPVYPLGRNYKTPESKRNTTPLKPTSTIEHYINSLSKKTKSSVIN